MTRGFNTFISLRTAGIAIAGVTIVLAAALTAFKLIQPNEMFRANFESHSLLRGEVNHHILPSGHGVLQLVLVPGNEPLTLSITGSFELEGTVEHEAKLRAEQEYGGVLSVELTPTSDIEIAVTQAEGGSSAEITQYRLSSAWLPDAQRGDVTRPSSFGDDANADDLVVRGQNWLRDGMLYPALQSFFVAGIKFQLDENRLDAAIATYAAADQVAQKLDEPVVIAWLKRWIATARNAQGKRDEARKALCEGLAMLLSQHDCEFRPERVPTDGRRVAAALVNEIGLTAHWREDLSEAERWYEAAIRFLNEEYPWPHQRAVTLNNLGGVAYQRADYATALDYFQEAYNIHVQLGETDLQLNNLSNLGLVEEQLGNLHSALDSFNQAITLADQLVQPIDEAFVLRRLGELNRKIGRLPVAQRLENRALEVMTASGDVAGAMEVRLILADTSFELGDLDAAAAGYRSILAMDEAADDSGTAVRAYKGLARVKARQGDLAEAFDLARTSHKLATKTGLEIEVPSTLEVMGDIAGKMGRTDEAIRYLETSREFSDDTPAQYVSSTTTLGRTLRDRPERALEVLASADPIIRRWQSSASDPLIEAEVRNTISQLVEEKIYAHVQLAHEDPNQIQVALRISDQMRSRVLDRLRSARLQSTTETTKGAFQFPALPPRVHIALYEIADTESYAWYLSRSGSKFEVLPGRQQLQSLVDRTLETLKSPGRSYRVPVELSHLLLGPIAAELNDSTLYVIADESLHTIPFAALPDPNVPDRPLLTRTVVKNLPNLGWLSAEAFGRNGADRVLAIGDPVHGGEVVAAAGYPLNSLPGTRKELAAIAAYYGTRQAELRTGYEATREAFLRESHSQYDVLHFALHGIVDRRFPELSGIFMSTQDASGHPVDGFISAPEIANLGLNAHLVVLSACDTAVGRTLAGEGALSLAWAFLAAGASHVVSSLWEVPDRVTGALMSEFYRQLRTNGQPPAEALRQAQIAIFRQHTTRSPYYWGAFVITGA